MDCGSAVVREGGRGAGGGGTAGGDDPATLHTHSESSSVAFPWTLLAACRTHHGSGICQQAGRPAVPLLCLVLAATDAGTHQPTCWFPSAPPPADARLPHFPPQDCRSGTHGCRPPPRPQLHCADRLVHGGGRHSACTLRPPLHMCRAQAEGYPPWWRQRADPCWLRRGGGTSLQRGRPRPPRHGRRSAARSTLPAMTFVPAPAVAHCQRGARLTGPAPLQPSLPPLPPQIS